VNVHPSIGGVCEWHLGCKVVGTCSNIFIVGSLTDTLLCATELKQILKVDFDMVLHVSNINLHVHYQHLNLEEARTTFERAVTADPLLSDLANMQIGVYTDGMRVAGVPVSIDAFVAKKARAQAKQDKVHVNRGRTRTNQGFGV